jgi:hypothetical protein
MMAQLIRPSDVKIITKDGELKVSITLDLNINMNGSVGALSADGKSNAKKETLIDNLEDKVAWAIPDFIPEKIDFGKKN